MSVCLSGPPLPPAPQLQELNATQLEVFWQEPFTWNLFPILSYNLTVYNTSSNTSNTYTLPGNETSMVITRETETRVCSQLMFKVSARNGEGESSEGTISGGFPVGESSSSLVFIVCWECWRSSWCENEPSHGAIESER